MRVGEPALWFHARIWSGPLGSRRYAPWVLVARMRGLVLEFFPESLGPFSRAWGLVACELGLKIIQHRSDYVTPVICLTRGCDGNPAEDSSAKSRARTSSVSRMPGCITGCSGKSGFMSCNTYQWTLHVALPARAMHIVSVAACSFREPGERIPESHALWLASSSKFNWFAIL